MQRHLYLLMKDSEFDRDEFNNFYPDVMTLPINKFKYTETPLVHTLSEVDIERLDLLMDEFYGVPEYDDIILWLNNIEFKDDLEYGDELFIPVLQDLNRFFIKELSEL